MALERMAIPGPALSCSMWVWSHLGDGRTYVLALEEETLDGEAGALSADLGSEQQQEGLSGQHSSREQS